MERALVTIGGSYTGVTMATPVIAALHEMGHAVDALVEDRQYGAETLLSGWEALDSIYLDRASLARCEGGRGYRRVVRTVRHRAGNLGLGPELRPMPCGKRHEAERNLTALRALGCKDASPRFHLEFDAPEAELPDRFIVVCPGCERAGPSNAARRPWPHWREFCEAWHRRTEGSVFLVGDEEDEAPWMDAADAPWLINQCGRHSICSAAGLIARCEALAGEEGAYPHIAAALGRPVVALFGPGDERKSSPYGPLTRVIAGDLFCRPCEGRMRRRSCQSWECITGLSVEQVLDAIAPLRAAS